MQSVGRDQDTLALFSFFTLMCFSSSFMASKASPMCLST